MIHVPFVPAVATNQLRPLPPSVTGQEDQVAVAEEGWEPSLGSSFGRGIVLGRL